MPFFHGTTDDRLPSIRRHGLGGVDTGPRSEPCARGVYLACDPRLAVQMVILHYLNSGGEPGMPGPRAFLEAVRVIVVDDARLDHARLRPDPQVGGWTGAWLYEGVVDVTNAPVVTAADVERGFAGEEPGRWGWRETGKPGEREA